MEHSTETTQIQADEEPECSVDTPVVRIEPAWSEWDAAMADKRSSLARGELGLDTDRPIVMSGHQPVVFHPGILAKLIALDEASKRTNAQAVWIVPDQDSVDPGRIRVPVGFGESLGAEVVELFPADIPMAGISACSLPAHQIAEPIHKSLREVAQWLDQFAGVDSLAEQFAYGTIEYACELLGIEMPRLLFASELFASKQIESVIETMRMDPLRCASMYNDAVAKHPDAGVRRLTIESDRVELPLWGCKNNQPRVAIDSINIDSFAPDELMPRGLLMSALARAHLADLFIHGTGGWIYDRISDDWFKDWLGIQLSPMAMVTATQRMDLGLSAGELIDTARAKWRAHHARHTPGMTGDNEAQQRKDTLVSRIQGFKRGDAHRQVLYQQLQSLLDGYRHQHRARLGELISRADRAEALSKQYELARDRTWAFVLFGQESLNMLDRATRTMLG